jgi:Zn finger protein HypA/HybF involved in hydrogenase expression
MDETDRVNKHYTKQLEEKTEAVSMIEAALEKARAEVADSLGKVNTGIGTLTCENNEKLKKHEHKLKAQLATEEEKLTRFKRKLMIY